MNRTRDDLRLLMDELLAGVQEAELPQKETIVRQVRWTSALLSLHQDGPEPAAEFLALPAELTGQLSGGLTDLDRGELVCRLEALRVGREVILRQLQVDDRCFRGLRQMAQEPESVKAVIREHNIPQSLYRLLHPVARKRPLLQLLRCLGRVKAETGRFPTCEQTKQWEWAAQKHLEKDAFALLLDVMGRGQD